MTTEPDEQDQDEPYVEVVSTEEFIERIEDNSNQEEE